MVLAEVEHEKGWEEFVSRGMEARESKDNSQWLLGDLAQEVETTYGEDSIGKYSWAIGVEKKTMMNYRTVAKRFNRETRDKYRKLSFSHFALATACASPEAWLEKADNNDWSVEGLRKEMREVYAEIKEPHLDDEPPEVYRCGECGLWRLKDTSTFEICRGHYVIEDGELVYK